jgi:predicted DNA-binding protein (MmcQ/YjbR family)
MLSEEDILSHLAHLGDFTTETKKSLAIFKVNDKIFLIIHQGTNPLRIDLKCDRKLSKLLQSRYETVMQSHLLGLQGIELILTGQLPENEVHDLIIHSYHKTSEEI